MQNFIKRSTLAQAIAITLALILLGTFLGAYNNRVIPVSNGALAHYTAEPNHPLKFLAQWDSVHYIRIAQGGYKLQTDAAFFPLYSILIALVSIVVGSPLTAALLVSWLSLVGATYYYMKLIDLWWKPDPANRFQATLLFVLFPTAVFMLAAYTEALFIFLSLAAIYHATTRKYFVSSLFLIGATSTRVTGIFTLIFVLLLLLERGVKLRTIITTGLVGMLGIGAYSTYLFVKYHNFLQFLTAQKYWGRFNGGYVDTLASSVNVLSLLAVGVLIVTAAYWFRKRKYSFAIYTALFLLVPFGTGNFLTFNRIALPAFPVMWMLYEITQKRPAYRTALLCCLAIFWTYYLLQFAGGYNGG